MGCSEIHCHVPAREETGIRTRPPARRELRRLLDAAGHVSIAGDAKDLATARGLADRTRPDVVFLDVQLGRESGFALLPDLDEGAAVIFVTAYHHDAIDAFEENALDYLLKPVDPVRLSHSLDRSREFVARPAR